MIRKKKKMFFIKEDSMSFDLTLTRTLSVHSSELFPYFIEPRLLEQWSAPNGLSLKIPYFEARPGGRYRYEHSSKDGVFVCEGHIVEVVPEKRLKMVDEWGKNAKGETMFENVDAEIQFRSQGGATEVTINQMGFQSKEMRDECVQGWTECLEKLDQLMPRESQEASA